MLYRDKKGSLKHEKARPIVEPILCEECSQGFLKQITKIDPGGKVFTEQAPRVPLYKLFKDFYLCKNCLCKRVKNA